MRTTKKQIIARLRKAGLPFELAEAACERFGTDAEAELRRDPFQLLWHVNAAQWTTVDRIARELGVGPADARRQRGALYAGLMEAASEGHTWCEPGAVIRSAMRRLTDRPIEYNDDVDPPGDPRKLLEELIHEGHCVEGLTHVPDAGESAAIQVAALDRAESTIAESLALLLETKSAHTKARVSPKSLEAVEKDLGISLAALQRKAVEKSLQEKVFILTGGPGTGKTTILRGVLRLWEQKAARIRLAAPTGRAAKKLAEATRRSASTIHRLLEYQPDTQQFARNRERRLSVDLMVVDEASMIDTVLMAALLVALPPRAHLMLVGDVDQLPSVGPGTVLKDSIASGAIPTLALTDIFRQSESSLIALNAQRVNRGEAPIDEAGGVSEGQDFYFTEIGKPAAVVDAVEELVGKRIPEQFGFSPKADVQVLVPMHKGVVGVENLNARLQAREHKRSGATNPAALEREGCSFMPGDKVMQTKNDYGRDVFNGDLGIVADVHVGKKQLTVNIDGREVLYEWFDLYNLSLAYAMTIHKSQGSEYPVVIVPLVMGHRRMLQRNLLYTAISRGQKLVMVIGNRSAMKAAIANNRVVDRRTRLIDRITALM